MLIRYIVFGLAKVYLSASHSVARMVLAIFCAVYIRILDTLKQCSDNEAN